MKLLTAALMAALLSLSTQAKAEVKTGTQQVSLDMGFANPLGNDTVFDQTRTFGSPGPEIGLQYRYQIQNNLSFGGDLSIASLGTNDFNTGKGPVEVKSAAWTLLAIGRMDLLPENDIRPYGLLGLGFGGVRRSTSFSQNPALSSTESSGGGALALGGGVDFDVNKAWLVGGELRYTYINTSLSQVGASSSRTLDFLLKIGYKFL